MVLQILIQGLQHHTDQCRVRASKRCDTHSARAIAKMKDVRFGDYQSHHLLESVFTRSGCSVRMPIEPHRFGVSPN